MRYGIAVVRSSRHRAAARAFVATLLQPVAQHILGAAGFTTLPGHGSFTKAGTG